MDASAPWPRERSTNSASACSATGTKRHILVCLDKYINQRPLTRLSLFLIVGQFGLPHFVGKLRRHLGIHE